MTDPTTAALLEACRDTIDTTLSAHLPRGVPVALVNFPNHSNAGDDAVWLGAEAALSRLGHRVAYRASWGAYHPVALRRAHPHGPVLLNGGGNLGDVYRRQQEVRERVLEDLADRTVVQLPQSIWFRDPANQQAFGTQVQAHGGLHLLVRDQPSRVVADSLGAAEVALCPDLALGLPARPRTRPVAVDVVWCARADPEVAVGHRPDDTTGVRVVDWGRADPAEPAAPATVRVARATERWAANRIRLHPRSRWTARLAAAPYGPLARHWVERALAMLSPGRVVVTERLHAHVFCLWLGIPHVILETRNGKIGALVDAWTTGSPLVHRAGDPQEALALARDLVGRNR